MQDNLVTDRQTGNLTGYPSIDKPWLRYYRKDVPEVPSPDQGMYSFLKENNKGHEGDIALNYFGKKISFGEMFHNVDRVASALKACGIKKGDVVSVCPLNTPEFFYLFYAINKIGAVSNWIGLTSPETDLSEQLKVNGCSIIFVVSVAYEKILKAAEGTSIKHIINVPIEVSMPLIMRTAIKVKGINKRSKKYEWNTFLSTADGELKEVNIDGSQLAIIEYTGGSTGTPKGVMLTNKAMNSYYVNFAETNSCGLSYYGRGEKYLSGVPLFLAFGASGCCHGPLCHGMELILAPDPTPEKGIEIILRSRVNHIITGRLLMEALAERVKGTKVDLSNVKSVMYGGEETNKLWERSMQDKLQGNNMHAPVLNGYGMTETAAAILIELNDKIDGLIPLANVNVKVIDPDDTRIEYGYDKEGELCVSSDTMMLGYYKNEKETSDTIFTDESGRWLKTHDLAKISEDGHIKITGRIKRIYSRLNPKNIQIRVYPMRIEECIMQIPEVKNCAVIGIKDDKTAYRSITYIIPTDSNEDRKQLQIKIDEYCRENLPDSHIPDEYIFTETFPITRAGKIDYRALEANYK